MSPDPGHPVSHGYACTKGLKFNERLRGEGRLATPLLRDTRGGQLRRASWDEALDRVGPALRRLRHEHGSEALGLYLGNAVIHNFGAVVGTTAFARSLGIRKSYSALTLDNAPQFVVAEAVFGDATTTFTADYAHSDCIVLFGTDPLASQPSQAQSNPDGVRQLLRAKDRLVVVDPRASATARHASLHLPVRSGTDRFLLAYLVREATRVPRPGLVQRVTVSAPDVAAIAAAVEAFSAERVSAVVGLDVATLSALADRVRSADRPLFWSGLGILLGPDATLGWWLTLCLQALTGGLDRPGGWVRPGSAVDLSRLLRLAGMRGSDPGNRSRVGGYPAVLGTHAAATMADDVLTDGPDRMRGLVVFGGNPLRSCPDTPKVREALSRLDLLVAVDAYHNDTTALADVVLPAATWLERWDSTLHMASQKPAPHLQVGGAVVPPVGEARPDWDVCVALSRGARRPLFGSWLAHPLARALGPSGLARLAVLAASGLSWSALAAAPRGLLATRKYAQEALSVSLAPVAYVAALGQRDAAPPGRGAGTAGRPAAWPRARRGPAAPRPATLHPADAARLAPDGVLRLAGRDGRCHSVLVESSPGVRAGVVILPYGTPVATLEDPGWVAANALLGAAPLDAFTGQPVSNGCVLALAD